MQTRLTASDRVVLGIDLPFFETIASLATNHILIMGHRLIGEKTGVDRKTVGPKLRRIAAKGFGEVSLTPNGRTRFRFTRGVKIGTRAVPKIGTRSFTATSDLLDKKSVAGLLAAYNAHIAGQPGANLPPITESQLRPQDFARLARRLRRSQDPYFWQRVFSGLSKLDWVMGRAISLGELLRAAKAKREAKHFRFHFRGFLSPKNDKLIEAGLAAHAAACGTEAQDVDENQLDLFSQPPAPTGLASEFTECYSYDPDPDLSSINTPQTLSDNSQNRAVKSDIACQKASTTPEAASVGMGGGDGVTPLKAALSPRQKALEEELAKRGVPVKREYEFDQGRTKWIRNDSTGEWEQWVEKREGRYEKSPGAGSPAGAGHRGFLAGSLGVPLAHRAEGEALGPTEAPSDSRGIQTRA